ncbi:hypothetical protein MW887_010890 [Aspergillus wentii]|nr:hypothetical protein MW887_010890 [Aspergillus wentii]
MSNTPAQQGGQSTSDRRYLDLTPHGQQGPAIDPAFQNRLPPEPPRFLFPDNQGYDPTKPSESLFLFQGKSQDTDSDQKFKVSSGSAGPLSQHGVQRSSPLLGNPEQHGAPSSYNEIASSISKLTWSRASGGSTVRTLDLDSQ